MNQALSTPVLCSAIAGLVHGLGQVQLAAQGDWQPRTSRLQQTVAVLEEWLKASPPLAAESPWPQVIEALSHADAPRPGHRLELSLHRACALAGRLQSGDASPQSTAKASATGLRSIFTSVRVDNKKAEHTGVLSMGPTDFSPEAFLPQPPPEPAALQQHAQQVLTSWQTQISRRLGNGNCSPSSALAATEYANDSWLTTFPASFGAAGSDISLRDHSRVVAALAAATAAGEHDDPSESACYRLVGYSLSGIQKFIFRQASPLDRSGSTDRQMAKLLRARSFYVSLLTHLIGRRLTQALGLPTLNIVLEAGARGLVLAPDLPASNERLKAEVRAIAAWMDSHLAGAIALRMDSGQPLQEEDFEPQGFAAALRRSFEATDAAAFLPPGQLWADAPYPWILPHAGYPVDQESFRRSIAEGGGRLPRASNIFLRSEGRGDWQILDYAVSLQRPDDADRWHELQLTWSHPSTSGDLFLAARHLPRVQAEDLSHASREESDEADDLRMGDPLPLDRIAGRASDGQGRRLPHAMLGVLKADVDNLGYVISHGLGPEASLSRAAALSRSLDWFFKGFLDRQIAENFPNTYTVFSGGDDLFLIGPWLDTVRLASALHTWFTAAVLAHPGITLSASVTFTKAHTPIRALATLAEEALEAAKGTEVKGRNRVNLAGVLLNWDHLRRALALHEQLLPAVQERALQPSLLHRLLRYGRSGRHVLAGNRVSLSDLKWRSQMSYDLARNLAVQSKESPLLTPIRASLTQITPDQAAVLEVAAMLTLYAQRGDAS